MQYGRFAELYDSLMSDVDYDAWAAYVKGFLPKGASVLECACGTGEITRRLAAFGFEVTASDNSADMLRVASEKLRRLGAVSKRVRFINMDMRELALHKPVDAVVCCCDGVNYLLSKEEATRFFASARQVLKPGGILLFDVSSRYKLEALLGQNCFCDNSEAHPYIWQNYYDGKTRLVRMELSFFLKSGKLYERFDEVHIQRAHSERELRSWLSESGFEAEAYECFTMDAPRDDSERLQFAARKVD